MTDAVTSLDGDASRDGSPIDGVLVTPDGSAPLGQECDQIQWRLGQGLACDALTAELVAASDLTADPRWPALVPAAAALGGRSAFAVRLHVRGTLGSMAVYAGRPVVPEHAAVEHLRTIAAHLSVLLDVAVRVHHIDEAMRSRGMIGQAIGLLAERYGIAADQAFAALRRISQTDNVKIAHLAAVLVETGDLAGLHVRGS